ncbi:hypothetical protein HZH68_013476 [Vespula germanica]|uniref:Uncharacterized protein n=1 Tax=Vespula germanica TaxID=30212 RepID=A0A834MWL1_VESGE|nr:hypothetical protein HZH68_013476 [Vespula germanica]
MRSRELCDNDDDDDDEDVDDDRLSTAKKIKLGEYKRGEFCRLRSIDVGSSCFLSSDKFTFSSIQLPPKRAIVSRQAKAKRLPDFFHLKKTTLLNPFRRDTFFDPLANTYYKYRQQQQQQQQQQ